MNDDRKRAQIEVICSGVVLPREAMGLGDVKFMRRSARSTAGRHVVFADGEFAHRLRCGHRLIVARKTRNVIADALRPYIALARGSGFCGSKLFCAFP